MKYDVAISFAGEQRSEAEQIVNCLKAFGVEIFYDNAFQAELWGKNLYDHLSDIYLNQAQYCLILVSKDYLRKEWTSHERQSAQARAFREKKEYILPVLMDDAELPGLLKTVGSLDYKQLGAEGICKLFLEKLGKSKIGDSLISSLPQTTLVKVDTCSNSPFALLYPIRNPRMLYVPVISLRWGSQDASVELEIDEPTDAPILDDLSKVGNEMMFAYDDHVALIKVMDSTKSIRDGAKRWQLDMHIQRNDFIPDMERALGGTSPDSFAEIRAKRLLLNENPYNESNNMNEIMKEVFVRGIGAAVEIQGSPLPQLYKAFGGNSDKFLKISWIACVFWLIASGTVAQILSLSLQLKGSLLEIDFRGLRKPRYINTQPYEIKVKGSIDLTAS